MSNRPSNSALDAILGHPFPVLNHGFIRVVDYMGGDDAVVQAARVSYGAGTKSVRDDRALIRYLLRHAHTTPFEMAELKIHVKLPIFVARQWIRHRMASVNEYSARYSVLDREFYIPEPEAVAAQSTLNAQGRGESLSLKDAEWVRQILRDDAESAYTHYLDLLNEDEKGAQRDHGRPGVARELARTALPVSFYTQWYWKVDLHNFMRFLHLRADPHAQWEIRQYANILLDVLARWAPLSYEAFIDYRLESHQLSRGAVQAVRLWLAGREADREQCGLSIREWGELTALLKPEGQK